MACKHDNGCWRPDCRFLRSQPLARAEMMLDLWAQELSASQKGPLTCGAVAGLAELSRRLEAVEVQLCGLVGLCNGPEGKVNVPERPFMAGHASTAAPGRRDEPAPAGAMQPSAAPERSEGGNARVQAAAEASHESSTVVMPRHIGPRAPEARCGVDGGAKPHELPERSTSSARAERDVGKRERAVEGCSTHADESYTDERGSKGGGGVAAVAT